MRIKMRHLISAICILFFAALSEAAAPLCHQVYSSKKLERPVRLLESSVEIEIGAAVIDPLMTTTDGTLRPVVGEAGHSALPENILKDIRESFPEMDPLDVAWDVLTSQEKQDIIMLSAKERHHNFSKSRTIPGLIYREQIKLNFTKPSRFMGKDYKPGTYSFNSKDIFRSTAIEFMGPNRMTENLGVEIHLRSNLGADENYRSSRSLQAAMVNRINNVHQHVVARLPIKKMGEDPERMAFALTEFIRRELIRVQFARIRDAQPIELIQTADGITNMPVTERKDFQKLFVHFLDLGRNIQGTTQGIQKTHQLNDRRENGMLGKLLQTGLAQKLGLKPLSKKPVNTNISGTTYSDKIGLIGVRSFDLYDGSRWQWGIEYRDLSPNRNVEEQMLRLKTAQSRMISQDYGIQYSRLDQWLQQKDLATAAEKLYFPDQLSFLGESANLAENFPHIPLLAKDPVFTEAVRQNAIRNKTNSGLNILFHDWAKDPIVDGNPALIAQIEAAREIALHKISRGESSNTVLQYFIKKSGLDYHLSRL